MSENEFSVNEFIVREMGYPGAIKQEVVEELVRCEDIGKYLPDLKEWYGEDEEDVVAWMPLPDPAEDFE